MTDYSIHKFNLTESQLSKLKSALENNKEITIKINKDKYHGTHPLPITKTEKEKIDDNFESVSITLSKKKLQYIKDHKEGGFLPLLSLIPLILGGLGAAGGVAGGIAAGVQAANAKKLEQAKLEEAQRHNREIESNLKASGSGFGTRPIPGPPLYAASKSIVGVTDCPACGSALTMHAKRGKDLYLRPY